MAEAIPIATFRAYVPKAPAHKIEVVRSKTHRARVELHYHRDRVHRVLKVDGVETQRKLGMNGRRCDKMLMDLPVDMSEREIFRQTESELRDLLQAISQRKAPTHKPTTKPDVVDISSGPVDLVGVYRASGERKFGTKRNDKAVPYFTLEVSGKQQTVTGEDVVRALNAADVKRGDRIRIRTAETWMAPAKQDKPAKMMHRYEVIRLSETSGTE